MRRLLVLSSRQGVVDVGMQTLSAASRLRHYKLLSDDEVAVAIVL